MVIFNNLSKEFSEWTKGKIAVANAYIYFKNKYNGKIFPSQAAVAKVAGTSLRTVSTYTKELRAEGFLCSVYRHFKTSRYRLWKYLFSEEFISKFSSLFPALVLLLSLNCVQSNLYNLYLYKSHIVSSQSLYSNDLNSKNLFKKGNLYAMIPSNAIKSTPVLCQDADKRAYDRHVYNVANVDASKKESMKVRAAIETLSKGIDLSLPGKLKLCIFDSQAITYANKVLTYKIQKGENIQDPFAFIFSCCQQSSIKRNIKPDYSIYEKLLTKYNLSNDLDPIKTSSPVSTTPVSSSLRDTSLSYRRFKSKHKEIDINHEKEGYTSLEKSDNMKLFASIFGDDGIAFLNRNKQNILSLKETP
jgi:hypothetical protein